jgi:hypothetical protein
MATSSWQGNRYSVRVAVWSSGLDPDISLDDELRIYSNENLYDPPAQRGFIGLADSAGASCSAVAAGQSGLNTGPERV